jgi:putative nucleotidyltransferase with HDIG domain
MEFELTILQGESVGKTFTIRQGDKKLIGRAPECDIRIKDQRASRKHCTVENHGFEVRVEDLGSANKTVINGKTVEKGVLDSGDLLTVGSHVFECRIKSKEEVSGLGDATLGFHEGGSFTVMSKIINTQLQTVLAESPSESMKLEDLQRLQRSLATAYSVSKMLADAKDLDNIFDGIIDSVFQTVQADRTALLMPEDEESKELQIVAARSRKPDEKPGEITVSRTVVKDVLEKGVSSLSQDARADSRYREGESIIAESIRSVMCVPMATDDQILGVLYADSQSLAGAFSENELELLAHIGNQAGVGIHRVQLVKELERFFFDTIRAIVATVDAKDGYTHHHSERVAELAVRIARKMGKSEDEIELVRLTGLLHDVGKIGIPESILNKPGRLSDEEFVEIKKHPLYGEDILKNIKNPKFKVIVPGVRNHHEKWDGSGYPDGLSGEEIPFLGRLLAVADVLDALSADRIYRKGMGFDKTMEIIRKDAGSHFDPQVAEAASALHERGELEVTEDWLEPIGEPEFKVS